MTSQVSRSVTRKRERLEAHITTEQKMLLDRAAALAGQSLTEFVISSAQRAAEETIREHEIIRLSPEDSSAFVEALLNPTGPNEHLRAPRTCGWSTTPSTSAWRRRTTSSR